MPSVWQESFGRVAAEAMINGIPVLGSTRGALPEVIDDYRHGRPRKTYQNATRPELVVSPDRSIFRGKRYLPIRLVEFARGCRFKCDFCAIQSYFDATHNHRPVDQVVEEIRRVRRPGQMIFFIDDNLTSLCEDKPPCDASDEDDQFTCDAASKSQPTEEAQVG